MLALAGNANSTPPASCQPATLTAAAAKGFAALDTTNNAAPPSAIQAYHGPVSNLSSQYIYAASDSLAITTSTDGWFIRSGSGTDAIALHGGTNVVDGGTGSNFLTSGTGSDTFFVDARHAMADIWSTLVDFHSGDAATVWGVNPHDFNLIWGDGQGTGGYTGLTLHASEAGSPTASLTLTGYSRADLTNGHLTVSYGTDTASGSDYMYIRAN